MTRIGSSDLDVFPLALGGNVFGWTADQQASFDVLDAYVEGGGNFIDTADSYSFFAPGNQGGESETVLGEWFSARGNRDEIVLATKVGQHPERKGLKADNIKAANRESLQRLQTDVIDLYWAHFDDADTPLEETIGAFAELIEAGTVRYVGISNYSAERIAEWMEITDRIGAPKPVALQPHYQLLNREPFESELRPLAVEHDLGVIPYFALASGFLTGKYQSAEDAKDVPRTNLVGKYLTDSGFAVANEVTAIASERDVAPATVALAWLRGQPTVVAPIASASMVSQVPGLLASADVDLDESALARLDEVSRAFQPA